jgi:CRISPR/Cas system CSM-associated protein Csm4 (group 5 of RAMP superfamily)
VSIGWKLGGAFDPMITLCHSTAAEHTHYAVHTIAGRSLSARDRTWKRKNNFKEGSGFYRKSVAKSLYKLKNQGSIL